MNPERTGNEAADYAACSEKLASAYSGDDSAVRALLALERVVDGS